MNSRVYLFAAALLMIVVAVFGLSSNVDIVSEDSILSGSTKTFNFSINNTGSDNITQINITLPSGFTDITSEGISGTGWSCSNDTSNRLSCSNSSLQNGETIYVWLVSTAPQVNNATVYTWNLELSNSSNSTVNQKNTTVAPDLFINDISWDLETHPEAGDNVTINASINFTGSGSLNGINVTFQLGSYSETRTVSLDSSQINNVTFNYSGISAGDNSITVTVDTGNAVSEYNESNNARTEVLSTYLNVTITSIISQVNSGGDVVINTTVRWRNSSSTPVSDLGVGNFSVTDGSETWNKDDSSFNSSFVNNGDGTYSLSIKAYNATVGTTGYGSRSISIDVNSANHSGTASSSYNLTAPQLAVTFESVKSLAAGEEDEFEIKVTNQGNKPLTDVRVNYTGQGDSSLNGTGKCSLGDIQPGNYNSCALKIIAASTSEGETFVLSATATGLYNNINYSAHKTQNINVASSSAGGGDGGGGGGDTGGGEETTEEKVVKTFKASAKVSLNTTSLKLVPGQHGAVRVMIENNGDWTLKKVTVSLPGVPPSWYTVIGDEYDIEQDKSLGIGISIDVPGDAEVAVYEGIELSADYGDNKKYQDEIDFTLEVSLTDKQIEELDSYYASLKARYDELVAEIAEKEAAGADVTLLKEELDSIGAKLNDVRSALDDDDYITAYLTLKDVKTMLEGTSSKIEALIVSGPAAFAGWVVLGVLLFGTLGYSYFYFMKPSKSRWSFGGGYTPVEKVRTIGNRIKKRILDWKKKTQSNSSVSKKTWWNFWKLKKQK